MGGGGGGSAEGVKEVQEACMQVVAHSCSDSVLRVFLAALVRREGGEGGWGGGRGRGGGGVKGKEGGREGGGGGREGEG